MASVTFHTHKVVRRLREAGFQENQAEALIEALRFALEYSELVTRKDLQIELAPIKSDLTVVKWMLGLLLGGVAALVLKSFF
ncbi:coiled-coil domain-containing protein [uncultured Thiohalocapsa sp.]|uniref:coiled-coil domain-containing protein n=1 Tax=uncultured Thiohalocapsa sp. TaxID=768990 RepID=UPI0025F28ED2|nr:coiled-coil domain-containing protein [uncultured Thiohalocapsa sp.]